MDLSAKVLVVLVALEYLIVLIVDLAILVKGGPAGTTAPLFDFSALNSGSLTVAVLFCLGSFIGIEATTIYGEEAKDPESTIPKATYLAVFLIGIFFIITTWLMVKGVGSENLLPTLGGMPDPTAFFFDLTAQFVGGPAATIAGLLLVSSLFAALSAFHNYVARYTYVAGREGLLPTSFGQTHDAHQSPHIGSVAQTIGSLIILAVFAGLELDPILQMFTWIAQVGTLGVLLMMAVTSLSVIAFFRKKGGGPVLSTLVLPLISAVIMGVLFVYIFLNFGDLTGTSGAMLGWVLPALIPLGALIGWLLAMRLKAADPSAYRSMGQNRL